MTDPIADMITRIRNAVLVRQKTTVAPHSKLAMAVVNILKENQYIEDCQVVEKKPQSEILITLKYIDKMPVISGIKVVSTAGRRMHMGVKHLPKVLNGYGIDIVSTNKGVMTDKQAKKLNVGGEVICQVW